jgi:hypothetical protein
MLVFDCSSAFKPSLLLFVDKARVGVNKPINEVLTIILSVVVLCRNIY